MGCGGIAPLILQVKNKLHASVALPSPQKIVSGIELLGGRVGIGAGVDALQWRTEGGLGVQPPPKIPKTLQNRAKFNPIVKTVKNY